MKNRVVTISREFGSGGRTIRQKSGREVGYPCYDSENIQNVVKETGFTRGLYEKSGRVYTREFFLRGFLQSGVQTNQ